MPAMGDKATRKNSAKRTYLSPQMEERRHRILQTARALIAEGGESNLTISRLCEQAQVSAKAVYLAFGDRDGIILAALAEHMDTIQRFLDVAPPAADTLSILREYDWIAAELFRGPEFARTIIGYYFMAAPREAAIASLRSVPLARVRRWFAHQKRQGHLIEGLDLDRLAYAQVDGEYTVLQRWASARIADEHMAEELKANFLSIAIIAAAEPDRNYLLTLLGGIHARLPSRDAAS